MPETPIYDWPTPESDEPPDVPADMQDLADEIEGTVNGIQTDFDARLTALEAVNVGWVAIDDGTEANVHSFLVEDIPVGTFSRLRLSMVGALTADTTVRVRVNSDSTAGLHKTGHLTHDALDGLDDSNFADATTWQIANWATASGNTAWCEMYRTDIESLIAYEGGGGRHGGSASLHRTTRSWGRLNSDRLIDSFIVFAGATIGTEFVNVRWQVEGRPV